MAKIKAQGKVVSKDGNRFSAALMDTNEAVFTFTGYIGRYEDIDPRWVNTEIDWAINEGATSFRFVINSMGGDVEWGFSLFNKILSIPMPTTCEVIGVAYSMAAIIVQAANTRVMHEYSTMMLHSPSSAPLYYMNATELRGEAETLDMFTAQFMSLIQKRTGKTQEEVSEWFKDGIDTYFTAQKALTDGLIDSLITIDITPSSTIPGATEKVILNSHNKRRRMASKLIKGKLIRTNEATGEVEIEVEPGAEELTAEVIAALKAENEDLKAKLKSIEDAEAQKKEEEVKTAEEAVTAAVNSRKISEAQKGVYLASAKIDPKGTIAALAGLKGQNNLSDFIENRSRKEGDASKKRNEGGASKRLHNELNQK